MIRKTLVFTVLIAFLTPALVHVEGQAPPPFIEAQYSVAGFATEQTGKVIRFVVTNASLIAGMLERGEGFRVFNTQSASPYTDVTGKLDAWIGAWSLNDDAFELYVEIPTIPVAGLTLYLYSGDTTQASELTTSIFSFHDGFEGTFTQWTATSLYQIATISDPAVESKVANRTTTNGGSDQRTTTFIPAATGIWEQIIRVNGTCQVTACASVLWRTPTGWREMGLGSTDAVNFCYTVNQANVCLTTLTKGTYYRMIRYNDGTNVSTETVNAIGASDVSQVFSTTAGMSTSGSGPGALAQATWKRSFQQTTGERTFDEILQRPFLPNDPVVTFQSATVITPRFCEDLFGPNGALFNCDRADLATTMGISATALNAGYGMILVLGFGVSFSSIPGLREFSVIAGAVGAFVGYLIAFFFDLFPLWSLLLLIIIAVAILTITNRRGGG